MRNSNVIMMLQLIILIGGVTMNAYAEEQSLSMEVTPVSDTVIAGGPCILNVTITNTTTSEIRLIGSWWTEEKFHDFYFEILDEKNNQVDKDFKILWEGGLLPLKRIPSKKSIEIKLVLNEWCSTSLVPGKYTIVSYYDPTNFFDPRVTDFKPTTSTIITKSQIEILPATEKNNKKLQEIFSGFLADIFTDSEDISMEQRLISVKALACNSPLAIPYLLDVISTNKLHVSDQISIKSRAIAGLRRIGTSDAAKELVNIAKNVEQTKLPEELKTKVVLEIFRLSETSKDQEAIEICKQITSTMPRPVELKPID